MGMEGDSGTTSNSAQVLENPIMKTFLCLAYVNLAVVTNGSVDDMGGRAS